jgi:hypothetical protein
MANGGSVSLDISTNFSRQGQRLGHPAANGVAVLGRAYVSITNTVTYEGQVHAITPAIRGLSVGRVGSHEVAHALGRPHGPGLMREGYGSEVFDPSADSQFRFSARDAAMLARRCRPTRQV